MQQLHFKIDGWAKSSFRKSSICKPSTRQGTVSIEIIATHISQQNENSSQIIPLTFVLVFMIEKYSQSWEEFPKLEVISKAGNQKNG